MIIPTDQFETCGARRTQQLQRQAWLAELRAIAEEVSARAALSDEEAEALIDEAQALIDEAGSFVRDDRDLLARPDEGGP